MEEGETRTLTQNVDTFNGTAGNDTANGVVDAAGTSTLGSVDTINGGAGTDVLNVRVVDTNATTVAPVATGVENFFTTNLDGASNFTLNFASVDGEAQVWSKGSVAGSDTRATNVDAGITAGLDSVAAGSTYSVNYSGAAARTGTSDAFALAVAGAGTAAGAATFNLVQGNGTTIDNSFEVANIAASGAASNVALNAGTGANGLRTINVTGESAGVRLSDAGNATSLRTVDASGLTGTGGLNLDASSSTQTAFSFTGSAQADRLVIDDAVMGVANTVSLNAGEGKDTLAISTETNFANAGAATLRSNINTKANNKDKAYTNCRAGVSSSTCRQNGKRSLQGIR